MRPIRSMRSQPPSRPGGVAISIAVGAVLVLVFAVLLSQHQAAARPAAVTLAPQAAQTPPPRIAITRPGQIPAYTQADVRDYIRQVGFPLGSLANGNPPPITKIEFVTREQAEALMRGESLEGMVAPGAIVCYVEFGGPIIAHGMMKPPNARPSSPWTTGHEVFDATTGGVLDEGLLP